VLCVHVRGGRSPLNESALNESALNQCASLDVRVRLLCMRRHQCERCHDSCYTTQP